ncbi:hypothetical protein MN086_10555 [Sulfurovum sp. XGS-02]|uniref:hypothetical protein n=1 Tax=Sulfurovum sp. XGS-02 TaxID=2925411 RepID=UPI00204A4BC1|nr:hypothetical protein [Sulfurovum sp. XGS-02]UPT77474.1 hypothetical protein MN086_10555 [Sulfurovum sp. XGS-02]
MRYLLIMLTLLLSLTGCEDKEQLAKQQAAHDTQIAQQARAELLAELEAEKLRKQKESQEKNETKLNKMGVRMNDGIITIDTNKTKAFFRDFNQKMSAKMKKISDDLEKGIIETKEAGVEMNEEYIHIDLNKTQDLLQEWGKKMQIFVQELDEMARTIETNASNTTNKGM